jgi:aryl-alcohol dehydrogenase-like predicted oxidoreductase
VSALGIGTWAWGDRLFWGYGKSFGEAEVAGAFQASLAAKGIPLATNQVPYSLLNRAIEHNGTLEQARQLGVTILAYSPLAQGLLTGKYTPATLPDLQGARRLDPRFTPQGLKKLAPLISTLQEIGEKYDRTPAQVALNWLMAQGNVLPIAGAKNADQAQQNAGALGWSLSPEAVDRLGAISLNATV